MRRLPWLFGVIFLLMACLFLTSCKKEIVPSQWAESMKIDGQCQDWETSLIYDEKNDVSYGVKNDDQTLYLVFMTDDEALQRRIMMNGLVIWLDDAGGKIKELGFKFPRGLLERGVPPRDAMRSLRNPDGTVDETQYQLFLNQSFRDIQLLGPKSENRGIFTHKEAEEIKVKFNLTYAAGRMVYEVCLPLSGPEKFPWTLSSAANIGIGIEQPEMEFGRGRGPSMRGGAAGDASGGAGGGGGRGSGGRGGRGGGGGGGMDAGMEAPPPGGFSAPKDFKVWMTVALATK